MRHWRSSLHLGLGLGAAVLLAGLAPSAAAAPCEQNDHLTRVSGGGECLLVKTFGQAAQAAMLFVLIHGAHSSGSPATSMVGPAAALQRQAAPNAVAVALLRPGYNNAAGEYSSGNAVGRADNFYVENIDVVADAIGRLKTFHKARRVVLIGHSSGAAIAGVILGRHPGLADAAVLAACPCDVPTWRAMRGRSGSPWISESALRYVERIPAATGVAVIVGTQDVDTPPALSVAYAEALRARGIAAELSLLDGIDHVAIIGAPEIIAAALRLGASP
ncbi:MAG: alpha/beta fold hydrolase [Rhodocyclales bacterium]|nr:alpha/beta fold hydrolase [Rhodocyclales bacterium]